MVLEVVDDVDATCSGLNRPGYDQLVLATPLARGPPGQAQGRPPVADV
jgi:hypothetical protein